MKSSCLLFSSLLLLAASTNAQPPANNNTQPDVNPQESTGRPGSLSVNLNLGNPVALTNWLYRRIHTVNFQAIADDMTLKGQTLRHGLIQIKAEGALLYAWDMTGDEIGNWWQTGRNAGVQVLPFTVAKGPNNQNYLSFNAVSLKNMNRLQESSHYYNASYGNKPAPFFNYIDSLDAIIFKWDDQFSFRNVKTFSFSIINAVGKVDVLNSTKKTRYLAIRLEAEPLRFQRARYQFDDGTSLVTQKRDTYDYNAYVKENGVATLKNSYSARLGYGLEYQDKYDNGTTLNVKARFEHQWHQADIFDPNKISTVQNSIAEFNRLTDEYTTNRAYFDSERANYNTQNPSNSLDEQQFADYSGIPIPVSPGNIDAWPNNGTTNVTTSITRQQFYFMPSVELSKRLNQKGAAQPVSIGARVSSDLPIHDRIKFKSDQIPTRNMAPYNRNLLNVSLFVNF